VTCDRTDTVLHGYFDDELDPLGAAEFERHLAHCSECTEVLESLRSLRSSIRTAPLYQKAPVSWREKAHENLNLAKPVSTLSADPRWRWLALAAALLLFAVAGWYILSLRQQADKEFALATEVIDAHLRSLEPGHLTDVSSSDQHTVKPWFEGKLDFAPPVQDFTERGFPLKGGRLEVIQGRTIAALVYGRQKHVVSVFSWPTTELDAAPHSGSHQGYRWIEWRKGGMEFYAVSDTALSDLEQLQQLFSP
jgi:anti-sigma factor RsiW